MRYDAQLAETKVRQYVEKHNRIPLLKDMKPKNGLPSHTTFTKVIGISVSKYCKKEYSEFAKNGWNKEKAIKSLEWFLQEKKRLPMLAELKTKNGLPTYATFKNLVGISVSKYCEIHYPELEEQAKNLHRQNRNNKWNKEKAILALEKFLREQKRLPLAKDMKPENGLPTPKSFKEVVGVSMGKFYETHYPELRSYKWHREEAIKSVDRFLQERNRLPKTPDMKSENGLPALNTFKKAVGMGLKEYCKKKYPQFVW